MQRVVVIVVVFTCIGLFETTQAYLMRARYGSPAYWQILFWQLGPWVYWMFVTPLVLAVGARFPLQGRGWLTNAPVHVALMPAIILPRLMLSTWLGLLAENQYYQRTGFWPVFVELLQFSAHQDVITYAAVLAVGHALSYRDQLKAKALEAAQLQASLVEASLNTLKMQLHPHFLFNTLHTIGVHIRRKDQDASIQMLTDLADMLRMTLDHTDKQKVPLDSEMAFVHRYISIERMRFSDRLVVKTEVSRSAKAALTPVLVVQPLVENAVRHGIAPRARGGKIEIRAQRRADRLALIVEDDGVGLPSDWSLMTTTGVGLANIRDRLQRLYPRDCTFTVGKNESGGTTVRIDIPFEVEEADSR